MFRASSSHGHHVFSALMYKSISTVIQCVLGKTSGDGGNKSGLANSDQRKVSQRSDSDAADLNICDPQGGSSQPTGGGTGYERQKHNNNKPVDRGTEKLQALMAEADRIAGGWKRNRLNGGGSAASDGEGVDVERNDIGKISPASSLFGGGKSFPGEGDDNCSESGAKSDSDNSLNEADVGRNMAQSQERLVYVARMPRRGMPYEHWSQKNLRLACRNRGIRSMSKCKDNRVMAKHLIELDKWEKRESPYLGDFRWEKGKAVHFFLSRTCSFSFFFGRGGGGKGTSMWELVIIWKGFSEHVYRRHYVIHACIV